LDAVDYMLSWSIVRNYNPAPEFPRQTFHGSLGISIVRSQHAALSPALHKAQHGASVAESEDPSHNLLGESCGRISIVAMARDVHETIPVHIYEWFHQHLWMWGLPVEICLAKNQ